MELSAQIRKIQAAARANASHIAPSDAQGILEQAYGSQENWPAPDQNFGGHYPIEVVQRAIQVIREKANEVASVADSVPPDPAPELAQASQADEDGDDEPPARAKGHVKDWPIPEVAQYRLMDNGLNTEADIRTYIESGRDLTAIDRIGEATANKIKQLLDYDDTNATADDGAESITPAAQ